MVGHRAEWEGPSHTNVTGIFAHLQAQTHVKQQVLVGAEKALPGAEGQGLTLQVLVLALQRFQVVQGLLIGILHLKQLRAERAGLLLGGFQLSLCFLILLLPFCQDLKRNGVSVWM